MHARFFEHTCNGEPLSSNGDAICLNRIRIHTVVNEKSKTTSMGHRTYFRNVDYKKYHHDRIDLSPTITPVIID